MSLDLDIPPIIISKICAKISAIHDFSHANSLLFTLHFITFYQPISNELKRDSLLSIEKNERMFGSFRKLLYLCTVNILKTIYIMEKVKRTREEVRAAFKDFMRRKKERQMQARMELEVMSQQGFFDN